MPRALPSHILWLTALYFLASLIHFAHNAEYIAYYPNMPAWITRDTVYLVWAAITSVGLTGIVFFRLGWRFVAALCLFAYGALGLDGLAHYTLAPCSEHTLAMNLTIWFEAIAGVVLAMAVAGLSSKDVVARLRFPRTLRPF